MRQHHQATPHEWIYCIIAKVPGFPNAWDTVNESRAGLRGYTQSTEVRIIAPITTLPY